jgi:hypothetical protein
MVGVAELDYQANHSVAGNEGGQWVVLMGQFGWKWWVVRLGSAHNGWSWSHCSTRKWANGVKIVYVTEGAGYLPQRLVRARRFQRRGQCDCQNVLATVGWYPQTRSEL